MPVILVMPGMTHPGKTWASAAYYAARPGNYTCAGQMVPIQMLVLGLLVQLGIQMMIAGSNAYGNRMPRLMLEMLVVWN